MTRRKRLIFDIETSPNIGFFWSAGYDQEIGHHNIIKERSIICICYKWEGEKTIHHLTWDNKQSDKAMLQKFIQIMNEADEVVGHNSEKFDIKWVRTRCAYHGIPMMPNYTSIDTYKAAYYKFYFNSNKLDYLGRFFGLGGKQDTGGFDLWKSVVLDNSKTALNKMVSYCKRDVDLLEKVFNKMQAYLPAVTLASDEVRACPECTGYMVISKHRTTASGTKKTTMQCKSCNKYHTIATSKLNTNGNTSEDNHLLSRRDNPNKRTQRGCGKDTQSVRNKL